MRLEVADGQGMVRYFNDNAKEMTKDVARRWAALAQDELEKAGEEMGWEYFPVLQAHQPPRWVESTRAWEFAFIHPAAPIWEFGSDPHMIRPTGDKKALKFPWPDAPEDLKGDFRGMWNDTNHWLDEPEVLLAEVHHPGTPALKFMRNSRSRLIKGENA